MKLLAASTAMASAIAGQAAFAQDEPQNSTDQSVAVEEIVVTANRREQKLQDVPIAISAVTADAAAQRGVTGTASLQTVVPNLVITRTGITATPYLRGLGSTSGLPTAEPSVAVYIDGVYHPSANANFFEFNNIERIEVLKGPQGTLFGRNATGGVIQIITKNPGSRPEAEFKIGYANYETVTANAYVAGPITDTLGANIAVLYKNQGDSWGKNIFTGEDNVTDQNFGIRGKLVWAPGDATTVNLSANYGRNRNGAINGQNPPGTNNPLGQPFPGKYNTNGDHPQRSVIETGGVSLRIEQDFGAFKLMSLSAYNKTKGYWTLDQDLSPVPLAIFDIDQDARMYSQEVHLLSPSSSELEWLIGAYYFNFKGAHSPSRGYGFVFDPGFPGCLFVNSCNPNSGFDTVNGTKSTSFAMFAQATYPILDNTKLTLGARYTWDKVDYFGTTYFHGTNIIPPPGLFPGFLGGPATSNLKHDKPSFRVAIDHKITPDVLVYASYNRGIKAGTIDIGQLNQAVGVERRILPETVNAYEAGMKTEFFSRKVRLNFGGFYYDFKSLQYQKISQGAPTLFNSPNGAIMYGGEADLEARVTPQLTLNSGIGYLHTRLRDFPGAPNSCKSTVTGTNDSGGFFCNGPDGLPDPGNLIPYNAKGNRNPNSPEWSFNVGAVYTIPSSVGAFTLSGNASYTSKRYFEIDNRGFNPAIWLFNASAMWTDASEHLTVTLWGRNLSNKYYFAQFTGQADGADIVAPAPPREYGVTLGYRF